MSFGLENFILSWILVKWLEEQTWHKGKINSNFGAIIVRNGKNSNSRDGN